MVAAAAAHGSSFSFFSSAAVEMTTAAETVSLVEMMAADLVVETALASSSSYFFFAAAVETAMAIQDAVAAANSTFRHTGDLYGPLFLCTQRAYHTGICVCFLCNLPAAGFPASLIKS